ncbi:hypothetical protein HK101_003742, partial [Irineochytrium annulatum]
MDGQAVQLYDQGGAPLRFDSATGAFYDAGGGEVHVEIGGMALWDHLGRPVVMRSTPSAGLGDPNGPAYETGRRRAEMYTGAGNMGTGLRAGGNVNEGTTKSAVDVASTMEPIKLNIVPVNMVPVPTQAGVKGLERRRQSEYSMKRIRVMGGGE